MVGVNRVSADMATSFSEQREKMVEQQLRARGILSVPVLNAMSIVAREKFVPERRRALSYRDSALPIGNGQTISQPYVVALMAQSLLLTGGEKVMEVGAGSGYAAAVISLVAVEVHTIERIESLAARAAAALSAGGYANITVHTGDGSLGLPEHAPFDAIMVTAGAPAVPEALRRQLKIGGRLVIPVGRRRHEERLLRVTRRDSEVFETEMLGPVSFVPLLGEEGW